MKIIHVHQKHVEKPILRCPHCGRYIFRGRYVIETDHRTVLCEDCVNRVQEEVNRVFRKRIREIVDEKRLKGTGIAKTHPV